MISPTMFIYNILSPVTRLSRLLEILEILTTTISWMEFVYFFLKNYYVVNFSVLGGPFFV